MTASSRVAYLACSGKDYGVQTGDIRIDMQRVRQRERDIDTVFVARALEVDEPRGL
jgi:hypothetical protein